jgi:hypothetical protein
MPRRTFPSLLVTMRISLLVLIVCGAAFTQVPYDLAIHGGRVIDPETSLDAIRDVRIRGSRIAVISEQPLIGVHVIDASGLVVAPGFIDLHQHDQTAAGYRLKAMDGVTTALELEIGPPDVRKFLDERRDGALINFGKTASHPWAHAAAFGRPGVGMGIQCTPGATHQEIIEMFRVAAERGVPVFVHSRGRASNRQARSLLPLRSLGLRCTSSISTAVACAMLPNACVWLLAHALADLTSPLRPIPTSPA